MRGRTLNDSFVILDEAQNTTSEQMKMFVTRLGFNSKAVITGDVTQIDLPNARRSGLIEAMEVLKNVEGLAFVHFDETDVVRHHLVQRIVRAYDEHKTRVAEQQMLLLAEPRNADAASAEKQAAAATPAANAGEAGIGRSQGIAAYRLSGRAATWPSCLFLAAQSVCARHRARERQRKTW